MSCPQLLLVVSKQGWPLAASSTHMDKQNDDWQVAKLFDIKLNTLRWYFHAV